MSSKDNNIFKVSINFYPYMGRPFGEQTGRSNSTSHSSYAKTTINNKTNILIILKK